MNKTETRVEARWKLGDSKILDEQTRARLLAALDPRLDADGTLRVVARRSRSQAANREEALSRLEAIVKAALKPKRRRRATKPTGASRRRRLEEKRKRGLQKRMRKPVGEE